ncbi:MAG TPA: hypothetical protein VGJ84_12855, partial [Polyangiaceae bacterium]
MPVVALVLALVSVASMQPAHAQTAHPGWCAPELESLSDSVCYVSPSGKSQTLVIFLHPLVGVGSNWQWDQQRWFARLARSLGFSVLMPRGRAGIGPGRSQDIYAWPTSQKMQEQHEDTIIAEWMQSKRVLEQRQGRFERVLVFGFSNGAYYAASLALRGRLPVDGYGVFAGGSGAMSRRL